MKGSAPVFDREFKLLLACSKVPADGVLIRSLAGEVEDWQKFLKFAEWHELTPVISHGLIDSACSLPSATSERLASKARENTKKNLLLTAELLRVVQALLGEEIRAIPYKGPVRRHVHTAVWPCAAFVTWIFWLPSRMCNVA